MTKSWIFGIILKEVSEMKCEEIEGEIFKAGKRGIIFKDGRVIRSIDNLNELRELLIEGKTVKIRLIRGFGVTMISEISYPQGV